MESILVLLLVLLVAALGKVLVSLLVLLPTIVFGVTQSRFGKSFFHQVVQNRAHH